jgi:hypothetical protein
MRYPASEKLEIIRLVEQSHLPVRRPLRFTSCDIFRVKNEQCAEHWGMGDIAGVLAQLRASPP